MNPADRVLDLGRTPEPFKAIDSRRGWRDDNLVERVGKKFQWVGFYEILGRITDNYSDLRNPVCETS